MAEQGQPVECMPSMKIPGKRPGSFVYGDGRGYYYHSEKVRSKLRMMRCIEKRTMGCRARAVMRVEEEGSPIMLTQASRSHNHQPDDVKGETKAMLATLKERAKKEEELRISEILDQEVVSYPKAAFAVTRKNARRAMKRMRSRVEPVCAALTSEQMGEEVLQHSYGDCTTTKEPHSDDSEATMSTVWEEIVQPDGEGLETTTVWQEILQPDDEGMAEHGQPVECMPSMKIPGKRRGSFVYGDGRGYYYHSERIRSKLRMMRCIERRTLGCRARASMRVEEGSPIMLTQASRSHNHRPDDVKGETKALLATLKERAKKEEELRISEIFDQEAVSYPKAAFAVIRQNARRAMQRMRSRVEPVCSALTSEQMGEEILQHSYGDCITTKVKEKVLQTHSEDLETTMSTVWEEIVQTDGEGLETITVWEELLQSGSEDLGTTNVRAEILHSGSEGLETTNASEEILHPGSDGLGTTKVRKGILRTSSESLGTTNIRAEILQSGSEDLGTTNVRAEILHPGSDGLGTTKVRKGILRTSSESLGTTKVRKGILRTSSEGLGTTNASEEILHPGSEGLGTTKVRKGILRTSSESLGTTNANEEILHPGSEGLGTTKVRKGILRTSSESLGTTNVRAEILQSGSEDLGTTNVREEILQSGSEDLGRTKVRKEILRPSSEGLGRTKVRAEILQPSGKGLGKASVMAEIVQPSSGGLDTTKVRAEILRPGSECLTATKVMAERLQPVSKSLATTKVREQYFIVDLPISGDAGETVASKQVVIILSLPHNHGNLSSN